MPPACVIVSAVLWVSIRIFKKTYLALSGFLCFGNDLTGGSGSDIFCGNGSACDPAERPRRKHRPKDHRGSQPELVRFAGRQAEA